MTLALDTNVLIDLINGEREIVRRRYDAALMSGRQIKISAIVMHEIVFGALLSARRDHQIALARRIATEHEVVDWTHSDAVAAAHVRAELERTGRRIGSFDTLLAGQSLSRGWTLVTGNAREFSRVRDLEIENWTRL